jgi:hypothetical protein
MTNIYSFFWIKRNISFSGFTISPKIHSLLVSSQCVRLSPGMCTKRLEPNTHWYPTVTLLPALTWTII